MTWVDEMFAKMEVDRTRESGRRANRNSTVILSGHPQRQTPGALDAWNALVSAITADTQEFNQHRERIGQTAVRIRDGNLQCEVYVPGMHSKRLVLTLDDDDLKVVIHPDFPTQPVTITIEPDKDGKHGFWVLGDSAKERKLSVAQLSEYLLRPVLSTADINREI